MPVLDKFQTSFEFGEVTPRLLARVDLPAYNKATKGLENAFVRVSGGATRRRGTLFVGEVQDSEKKVRLLPYNQEYTLVLNGGCIEVIKQQEVLTCPTTLFLDTFTGTDGTLATAHTIDVAPPGTAYAEVGAIAHNTIQGNTLAGVVAGADTGYLEATCALAPTFPYSISMTGTGNGGYASFRPYNEDDGGVLIELYGTTRYGGVAFGGFYLEFELGAGEHTIAVLVEDGQATFSCDPAPLSVAGDHNDWEPEPYVGPVGPVTIGPSGPIYGDTPSVFNSVLLEVGAGATQDPRINQVSITQECA